MRLLAALFGWVLATTVAGAAAGALSDIQRNMGETVGIPQGLLLHTAMGLIGGIVSGSLQALVLLFYVPAASRWILVTTAGTLGMGVIGAGSLLLGGLIVGAAQLIFLRGRIRWQLWLITSWLAWSAGLLFSFFNGYGGPLEGNPPDWPRWQDAVSLAYGGVIGGFLTGFVLLTQLEASEPKEGKQ